MERAEPLVPEQLGRDERVLDAVASREPKRMRIQRSSPWSVLRFAELWEYRDLFVILALRDVKLRYRQTALGVIWVILQPLLAAAIFAVIFGLFARLPSDGVPYLVFCFAGLLPWTLFAQSLQRAGNSLISDSHLISKVYFPRAIIPISSVFAVLVDTAVATVVMAFLLLIFQIPPTLNLLAFPALMLIALMCSVGISLAASALNVYYRDFMYALPFIIQVWMFASPVVYGTNLVPERWRAIYSLNPMAGVIEGVRWCLLGTGEFPALHVGMAAVSGILLLGIGSLVFRRIERGFADVI